MGDRTTLVSEWLGERFATEALPIFAEFVDDACVVFGHTIAGYLKTSNWDGALDFAEQLRDALSDRLQWPVRFALMPEAGDPVGFVAVPYTQEDRVAIAARAEAEAEARRVARWRYEREMQSELDEAEANKDQPLRESMRRFLGEG
jgi:hypothetical protein